MKYFFIFWFFIGAPFIFPYIALRQRVQRPEERLWFIIYGTVAVVMSLIYTTIICFTILALFRN